MSSSASAEASMTIGQGFAAGAHVREDVHQLDLGHLDSRFLSQFIDGATASTTALV
jgi:hypothetical protein